ncbi:2-C-methyl-D-erythritol 2,4-cyclodiphosphate synthase [Marinicella sp. S1101]|uniref:2-C-methyl-D-erythritol 2,4-cyclodiphosphate synthase n=1 Tax=Marinicella marina TaxID=2996016 RepID=UPI002260BDEA|nr:2-C-methyl-D-erythritol 2,4-cyclodiphosphate synthase [Marinicella marina]MCX7552306.1 2-C-methyl-D-erythritol 2,4-cyclodiphosphate synthase [Marinicella marina]MDJ1139181.1 2-C-methyl-D-erythritol 2,4-cyclodiphosphate synthase [Marinicella marina]
MRIGNGFDVHAFGPGDYVTLGNIKIPHDHGFIAHSDGDVLIHAICDALLGACALGDIGQHFPPSDPQWKGCDSVVFLKHCHDLIGKQGYQIGNIDCTIICEAPKIGPHVKTIQARLAEILNTETNQISIKATTTEKLGFTGRGEGIAAQAVCLLLKQ